MISGYLYPEVWVFRDLQYRKEHDLLLSLLCFSVLEPGVRLEGCVYVVVVAGGAVCGGSWAQNGHVLMEGRLLRREGTNLCPAQCSRKLG